MNQDVIQVPFEGVAVRKLHDLFERGYTVCGVAIQRPSLVADADRGAITTHGMVMWWPPEQHKIEQVPAPKNLYEITGNVAHVNTVLIERAELHRLQAENAGVQALIAVHQRTLERCLDLKAECAELEAMLDAVGAGGVGQSIKPQIQADTSPAAWAIYSDDGTAIRLWSKDKATAQDAADKFGLPLVPLYTAPQPTENLRCKSTQKRLATLWGYVKQEPDHFRDAAQMVSDRQPLTDEKLYALYCEAMKGYYVSSLHYWRDTEAHKFARAIEAAAANQPPRQPLTEDQIAEIYAYNKINPMRFARAVEAAHGITEGQQ